VTDATEALAERVTLARSDDVGIRASMATHNKITRMKVFVHFQCFYSFDSSGEFAMRTSSVFADAIFVAQVFKSRMAVNQKIVARLASTMTTKDALTDLF
jgi:hypothetical protein